MTIETGSRSSRIGFKAIGFLFLLFVSEAAAGAWAAAQDYQGQEDPPGRVARLGYLSGSVSFQPGGEGDWVDAVENRPMTIGDKLWCDRGSRAELQLGDAAIRVNENTGVSFLNLEDRTLQLQLSSGAIEVRVRQLDRDEVYEIDTPNLAFTISQPGKYRLQASENGDYTVVAVRDGDGEATGNGQTYTLHSGQRATFNGTSSLNAEVEQIGAPDQFDSWADGRERRWADSRSARYLSRDCVGYEDLDDYGDWNDDPEYGHVWYPGRVEAGWVPYRMGHWAWIDPWGYTWVDSEPWGYAPFHYGRWAFIRGRWGWVPGPITVRPVYAPALVVFVGGAGGANVAWFPLGPREVYVPSYRASRDYVTRVNVSNTVVNTTTITNVYNTTIVNKSTNITNVTYANRSVQSAVTAVPQHTFASAQPVAQAAVRMNPQQIASAPVTARAAVAPTRQSVFGEKAATVGHAAAPPASVINRQVVAKTAPPQPPPSFSQRQQQLTQHPGQPIAREQLASMRPAAARQPEVKIAPPGKPATPATAPPAANAPTANQPQPKRPGQPEPAGRAPMQPANRPLENAPNRPSVNQPQPENRPPAQPENRPPANPNRPEYRPPQPNERPPAAQPENRPPAARPENRPQPENPPAPNRTEPNRPPQPAERTPSPENRPPAARPENRSPQAEPNNRPAPPPNERQKPPEEKKKEEQPK